MVSLLGEPTTPLPSRIGLNFFESFPLAGTAAARMEPEAILKAFVAQERLSPRQRTTIADEYGVGQGNSVYDFLLRSITNPAVLVGAVLAIKYPIPLARNMFKLAKHLGGEDAWVHRKVGGFLRRFGSVPEIYAGSDIPKVYSKLLQEVDGFRRKYADRIGQHIIDAEKSGLKFDRRTQVLLSAKLDGLDEKGRWLIDEEGKRITQRILRPIQEGPVFDRLVKNIRGEFDELWETGFGSTFDKRKKVRQLAYLKHTSKGERQALDKWNELFNRGGTAFDKYKGRIDPAVRWRNNQLRAQFFRGPIEFIDRYFPHQVVQNEAQFEDAVKRMVSQAGLSEKVYGEQALGAAKRQAPAAAIKRLGGMVPDPADLKIIQEYVQPGVIESVERYLGQGGGITRALPRRPYSLKFMRVASSYIHSLAKTHGWTLTEVETKTGKMPLGLKLIEDTKRLEAAGDITRAQMMKDSYIPLALGRQTHRQAMKSIKWNDSKVRVSDWLKSPEGSKLVPGTVRTWLLDKLQADRGFMSLQNISSRLTGNIYLGALGGNPVSASYNMMQTILTTVPAIGPKWAAKGLEQTFKKGPTYFKARGAGLTHEAALTKAFPEYAESGLVSSQMLEDYVAKNLNRSWEASLAMPSALGKKAERVKDAMMAMFATSENMVRLTAFEGAFAKAIAEGETRGAALDFANRVTQMTQYLAGPANVPAVMADWNPLLRMFGQFPARTAALYGATGHELGTAAQTGFLGRNWGFLGRGLLASTLAYEAGQSFLDRDLSHGLLWGALPQQHPEAPFFPAPFVPPILSVGGAVAQDVLTGELKQTPFSLPLLVPGGLAAARFSTMLAPDAAALLNRNYADYGNRTQDGRIPIRTPEGGVRAFVTPWQLFTQTLGLGGGDAGLRAESDLQRYLLVQRDEIRQRKRSFLDKIVQNDSRSATQINEQFKRDYPMYRNGLQVSESDLRAVHLRHAVPRLERILETMPAEARSQFAEMIRIILAEEAEGLLGVDPYLLSQQPSISRRDPWRRPRPQNTLEALYQIQVRRGQRLPEGQGGEMPGEYGQFLSGVGRTRGPLVPRRGAPAFGGLSGF